jgi:hypothetical protein
MSYAIAMVVIPIRASRDSDPRRGLTRTIKQTAIAAALFAVVLKFIWKHFV